MPRKKLAWSDGQVETFKRLCSIMCTRDEICTVMGCTSDELEKLVDKHLREDVSGGRSSRITFDDAWGKYSSDGKVSLRRMQFDLAAAGDRAMLVWLGKQYLGQSDPKPNQKSGSEAKRSDPRAASMASMRRRSPAAGAAGAAVANA